MKIPITYYREIKVNGDLANLLGVLKVENNRVFILEIWK